jgi:hypothetical protein
MTNEINKITLTSFIKFVVNNGINTSVINCRKYETSLQYSQINSSANNIPCVKCGRQVGLHQFILFT